MSALEESVHPLPPAPRRRGGGLAAGALFAFVLALGAPAEEPAVSAPDLAEKLLRRAEEEEGTAFWGALRRLEALGEEALASAVQGLGSPVEKRRLACSWIALRRGDEPARRAALSAVSELARGARSSEVRAVAIELLGRHGEPDEVQPFLEEILEAARAPEIAVPAACALWELDRVPKARDRLVDLLGSKDPRVRERAALALADMDVFEGDVRDVLRSLRDEPSETGRLARALEKAFQLGREIDAAAGSRLALPEGADPEKLLELKEKRIRALEERIEALERGGGAGKAGGADFVIDEAIRKIQRSYVDESKTDRTKLTLGALEGMAGSLDEFSSFLDPEETKSFLQTMSGEYFGIGARVQKSAEGPLEIAKPIYGGPAHKAGLLSGDLVIEIDGVETSGLPLPEIIEKLKGAASTKVRLKVKRREWSEPKEFVLERGTVEVPSVAARLLPGGVGYVRIFQFGEKSAAEFGRALDDLENRGMEGLVIDLRNDPGGRLDAAVEVVDQFVPENPLPIVSQKGRRRGRSGEEVAVYPTPFQRPPYPIVVLVNEASASASEIVAGALQDYGRAVVVGKRTFGKGSVQQLIPLSPEACAALGGPSQLRLTVQYYFLPLGRCVHTIRDRTGAVVEEGGVRPDIEAAPEAIPLWRYEERERLRTHPFVLEYVERHAKDLERLFLEGDGGDPDRYPEISRLHESLATPAPKEDLRSVLRSHARRRIEDAGGSDVACDVYDDVQLEAAVFELLRRMGKKVEEIPEYAGLAARRGRS